MPASAVHPANSPALPARPAVLPVHLSFFLWPALFCASASAISAAPVASVPGARLDATVTVLEKPDEASAVLLAERDLEQDLKKVFGKAPRVVHSLEGGGSLVIVVDSRAKGAAGAALPEPESFTLTLDTGSRAAHGWRGVIHLAGAGPRGAIYAIYTFSERYLGVDPLYYWTDRQPPRHASIDLPATLGKGREQPLFQYRGLFINDEDLLTGWAPAELREGTGISLKVWDKVFETILRLKGNMVAPGTWTFPDDAQMKAANARGLILTQHHAMPLGVNVARWPKNVPYNYTTHPEVLQRAWRNAVAMYAPDAEVVWSVGLRGLSDTPYDSIDLSVQGNDQALGALVGKAIADQMAIVRERFPQAKFVTNLWREGARLVQAGYLHIPPEVTIVWADSGAGDLQGNLKAGEGAYLHVAMVDGASNQLSELVPVERLYSAFDRLQQAHATGYLLLNTSDLRPVVMTTRAVMEAAWSGVPHARQQPGPHSGDSPAEAFYQRWAAEQYGQAAAVAVASLFPLYFAAPAIDSQSGKPIGDQGYHAYARQMILDETIHVPSFFLPDQRPLWEAPVVSEGVYGRSELPKHIAMVLATAPQAQQRWDHLWAAAVQAEKLVPADRRQAYAAQVLTMIAVNQESNRMLLAVARSIHSAQAGQTAGAERSIRVAEDALARLSRQESAAEYGKWKHWYRGDWLVGVPRTAEQLAAYERYLKDPLSPMLPPLTWSSWEAYYRIMHYEGDRTVDVR
jgi:hypothetical protein